MCGEKSLLQEIDEVNIVMGLIFFGVRMQVLELEILFSCCCLFCLYKELCGCLLLKGMLFFFEDWFMLWEQNIYFFMFYNIYFYLKKIEQGCFIEMLMKIYCFYFEQCSICFDEKFVLGLI